ncbi:MAG: site-specific DNA-methyltransferase [Acidobacteria bacterium]|nr:site-specific DNA-methyltransferase [Acidobacteriota bacterium]
MWLAVTVYTDNAASKCLKRNYIGIDINPQYVVVVEVQINCSPADGAVIRRNAPGA